MFTLDQIKAAHSKVKSGADFPSYFSELKQLGVTFYQTFVEDGHTVYHGREGFELISGAKFAKQHIADASNASQFKHDLARHQQGGSDYLQFTRDCAVNGVVRWEVCMDSMTCTYLDKAGNKMLVEKIPA